MIRGCLDIAFHDGDCVSHRGWRLSQSPGSGPAQRAHIVDEEYISAFLNREHFVVQCISPASLASKSYGECCFFEP